ncbi:hypothetical protein EKO04_008352 [Ascochyta lentis]|uniref:Galactose oxidase n=1 Tax=Ascochyta lentis TaxID=205686 RepID=A0A8H7MHT3_9PLEO|nr:hypothetical protein EKO04_008352 [Ascochyta lentis]
MRSTTTPARTWLQWSALLHVPLLLFFAAAQMPHNPTRLLHNGNHIYVFQPSSRSSAQFQLGSIDVSTTFDAASLPYTTLYPTLPFLNDTTSRAFTPVLDDGGNLTVYTGNCSQGASGGEIWSFIPATGEKQGSWFQQNLSIESEKHAATIGANYLSNGISFSSIVGGSAANTGVYFFGGMCPSLEDDSNNWQSAANYSNLMVTLEPSGNAIGAITYKMDVSPSRGPPIPEAGFTMTGLTPTYSNRSDGSQTQQQNFVLVGGHTSAAFINMSQVALFSLPEQGWTFISIQQPNAPHASLSTRDTTTVDPRSGHTAVLSSDGQQIIIYGGWVGDITSPAEPQLAVLNIADGFGGNGDWRWEIPDIPSGSGSPGTSSLYGHGAVMLPGGVMMVTGGYSIPTTASRRRRDAPVVNTKTYFLNLTSNTWITDYYPPPGPSGSGPTDTGPLSSPGQRAGLGVGIGIGLAAVCGLFAFYMWYTRRLQKQRDLREKQLQELSLVAHRYNIEDYSLGFDGRESQADAMEYFAGQNGSYYFTPGSQGGQGWKSSHGQDAERTGLLLEIPSPTRGLRRSLSGRPAYAMGIVRGPGQIHPIDELEEGEEEEEAEKATDETPLTERREMSERKVNKISSVFDNAPQLDPFSNTQREDSGKKSTIRSASSSPILEDVQDHGHPMTESEWPGPSVAAVRRSNTVSTGRMSPDKSSSDERTNSNLSERSTRSNLSWTSSHGSLARSASVRAAAVATTTCQVNPFRSPDASPIHNRPHRCSESGTKTAAHPRTQSSSSARSNGYADIDTFRTAQSSFAHLQAEGENLLGCKPEQARPETSSTSNGSNPHPRGDTEAGNSRAATVTLATSYTLERSRPESRDVRKSWLGSVRRVLRRSASGADRTRSLTNTVSNHEPYTDNPASPVGISATDNRKSSLSNVPPRRAASDASFWKSRRGKQDWEEELENRWTRNSGDDWGAPEDIARTEKDRLRQEWRERGNLLVNLTSDDELPTPRTPITPSELGVPNTDHRPCTPADEGDWDVEAAVERRVVQVMFTVPKSKLRVVNADPDGSSILSLPQENFKEGDDARTGDASGSPSRVKDLAGKFEQMSSSKASSTRMTPRASPVPSPSPSVKSMKIRARRSLTSLNKQSIRRSSATSPLAEFKANHDVVEE